MLASGPKPYDPAAMRGRASTVAYIDTWSFRHDVQILLRTVPVVLTARSAH